MKKRYNAYSQPGGYVTKSYLTPPLPFLTLTPSLPLLTLTPALPPDPSLRLTLTSSLLTLTFPLLTPPSPLLTLTLRKAAAGHVERHGEHVVHKSLEAAQRVEALSFG